MKIAVFLLIGALWPPLAQQSDPSHANTAAQSTPQSQAEATSKPAQGSAPLSLSSGTTIPVELAKSLDAKKAKPGDIVQGEVLSDVIEKDKVVVKHGSKVLGQVTAVQMLGKGNKQSEVAIVLDKLVLKSGETFPLTVAIQAVAAPAKTSSGVTDSGLVSTAAGVEPAGRQGTNTSQQNPPEMTAKVGSMTTAALNTTGGSRSGLSPTSKGFFGISGLGLRNEVSGSSIHSVFFSVEQNVHLESGTQVLLRVIGE